MNTHSTRNSRPNGPGFFDIRGCVFKMSICFLFLSALSGCGGVMENPALAKPSVPIEFGMTLVPSGQVPDEFILTARGVPGINAPLFRIRIPIPEGVEVTGGLSEWEGPLNKGEEKVLELFLKVSEASAQRIFGFASIEFSDGTKLTQSATVTLEPPGGVREKNKKEPPVKKNRFNENVIEFPGEDPIR